MGNFFHGWRRKIGVVTLLMACVFMAGWVRSLSVRDIKVLSWSNLSPHRFISQDATIAWQRFESSLPVILTPSQVESVAIMDPKHRGQFVEVRTCREGDYQWGFRGRGFSFGHLDSELSRIRGSIWIVPYWSIVTPLTLLSACLLLSQRRRRHPKKVVETTTMEAA